VGHILVRRCPHSDNSDDIRVTMSAGTNPPNRVIVFALLYLSLHLSSRSLVGIGGKAEETLCLALANAMVVRKLLERGEIIVDSGKWTAPHGNKLEHIGDSTSGHNSVIG
jgi:hypothetical protein